MVVGRYLLFMIFIATLNARIEIFDSLTPDSGLFKAKFSSGAEKLALYSVSDDIKLIDMNYLYEVGTLVNNKQIFDVDLSENGHVLLACEYTTESVTDCRYYQEDKNEPVMEFRLLEKITHPKVSDCAVIGVPNEEFGEEVKAVIEPIEWSERGENLEEELINFCKENLSSIKCPKSIDFEKELPRHPTGKLYKRLLKDRYWGNKSSKIV